MRVLVVEDEGRLREIIARGLSEAAYAVDAVADGEAALRKMPGSEYDAIILDVRLPGKDGFEVCRRMRDAGVRTPVLMLTARDAVDDRVMGLDAGADDYLTKPFDFRELLARLRALLRRPLTVELQEIRIADLTIDTLAQTAERSGVRIRLTTKEYGILEFLARHAHSVVTRRDLVTHVWDENHDPFSNAIEVHINRLRRKVDGGHQPLIHTRRGAGYMLSDRE
jgi:DNA-binding response OmpR family regulator